ncbi:uncharacterized protein BDR25DRAFT_379239 [Lindgomyces ingoldianus]|uniref:Uncharacterized protein n=1 Tax=Lindgomyces ingoldianus TaxID=673940 RepID=A0ACB6R9L9_9PLEO|nr:uncharacterized protein BDR25DRAFT_379239 [Lindgomyces ingoldianus]KAF2475740.1 hypothetical protein BDR25DRAFT_379239 [Lindgomyces ingoldianus]
MSKVATLSTLALLVQSTMARLIFRSSPDFGSCFNPTIEYVKDQDGIPGYGYKPANAKDFAHGASPDVEAITEFICSNLQNVCRAPATSYDLCKVAASNTQGKKEKDAADAFNIVITSATPPTSSSSSAAPSETPNPTVEPKVNIKFSKETVALPGHIDPKWWFDNYFTATGIPALCDETAHRMPDNNFLTFSCEGADNGTVPMMKAILNSVVDATIDNTTAKDEERIFKHDDLMCHGEEKCVKFLPVTIFPQSVHVAVAIDIPNTGGALSGNMRYTISKSSSDNCKLCSFLSAGGGGTAASAKIVEVLKDTSKFISPGFGIGSAIVTLTCLSQC